MAQITEFAKFEADIELAIANYEADSEWSHHLNRAISRAEFKMSDEERDKARKIYKATGARIMETAPTY